MRHLLPPTLEHREAPHDAAAPKCEAEREFRRREDYDWQEDHEGEREEEEAGGQEREKVDQLLSAWNAVGSAGRGKD